MITILIEILIKQKFIKRLFSSDDDVDSSSGSSSSGSETTFAKLSTLTTKEWVTICMLATANLGSTTAFSCIAPFYPNEVSGFTRKMHAEGYRLTSSSVILKEPDFWRSYNNPSNLSAIKKKLWKTENICLAFFAFFNKFSIKNVCKDSFRQNLFKNLKNLKD